MTDSANGDRIVVSKTKYVVVVRDNNFDDIELEFDSRPTEEQIEEQIEEWVRCGDWGSDGAVIETTWKMYAVTETVTVDESDDDEQEEEVEEDREEIDHGWHDVDIEPDHERMISRTCGYAGCGSNPDDHDWTSEGEGGCDDNPGVWTTGGTSFTFSSHCRKCGLHRTEHVTGSQRNPGEHDTVEYTMPNSWCAECQSEDCGCDNG